VDIPAALLNQLAQLAHSIGVEAESLHRPLTNLGIDLRAAIPSYRGLQVIIISSGQPVTLTGLLPPESDGAVSTSLRVPLGLLGPEYDHGSRVILYAGTPGAFVDLAADLGYVLKAPVATHQADGGSAGSKTAPPLELILDGDLSPNVEASGLTGLSEFSAVNRAIGILIDQGHNPDLAYEILGSAAVAAGVEPHVYAVRMLLR
jgi:hypothetical protein